MILTGTNYGIRSDSMENQRLHGSGLYNVSRAEHFLKLYNKKSVVAKGVSLKPSEQQQDEITLRVDADKPRKRIQNKTVENSKRAVSGRSTQGIDRDRKKEQRQSFAIMKANTKRQMADNQQPIMKKDGLKRNK
jgi:UDP-2,3-diacylglucosamine pyrophosphatase LpxH